MASGQSVHFGTYTVRTKLRIRIRINRPYKTTLCRGTPPVFFRFSRELPEWLGNRTILPRFLQPAIRSSSLWWRLIERSFLYLFTGGIAP